MTPKPFRLEIPDSAIADLKARLGADALSRRRARRTLGVRRRASTMCAISSATGRTSSTGARRKRALNAFPQFKVPLHDIDLHYLHVPGKGPNPYPLLLLHGWPGSVYEFLDIIPRLTDPARFGGDPKDAFTVIAPSLPGYGLSFKPGQKRFILQDIAACVHDLMTQVLGYQEVRGAGRRLGRRHCLAARPHLSATRLSASTSTCCSLRRDPRVAADAGGAPLRRRGRALAQGRDRLSADPGHQAADAGVWADGFAGRAGRLDRREIPQPGRIATASPRTRLSATACSPTSRCTGSPARSARRSGPITDGCTRHGRCREEHGHGADRLRGVPEGDRPPAALDREQGLHRHPALDRDEEGRPLRRDGTTGGAGARDSRVLPAAEVAAFAMTLSPRPQSR